MIENSDLQTILETATDISVVCEIYDADTAPTANGFDPNDALGCFAATSGIEFMGVEYDRLVERFGKINRKITASSNTATVEFSNLTREMSDFEFAHGFEGLIMVIRLVSRSLSTTLAKSEILFTGRCEKPKSGTKTSLSVSAVWILGGLEVTVPRRKYSREDAEGRVSTDPEFEGFIHVPQYGTTDLVRKRRGLWGMIWYLKLKLDRTRSYSSYSDVDANKPVPLIFGRQQVMLTHIAYADVGTYLKIRSAACEGPISSIDNARSIDSRMPLSATDYVETMGLIGAANNIAPTWPGPGNYSRTACITGKCTNSTVDAAEPAPDIVAVIKGLLMTIPDEDGAWLETDEWTDNAAAHTRYLLTSSYFFDLAAGWLDDTSFTEAFDYNDEYIIDRSLNDFIFVPEG